MFEKEGSLSKTAAEGALWRDAKWRQAGGLRHPPTDSRKPLAHATENSEVASRVAEVPALRQFGQAVGLSGGRKRIAFLDRIAVAGGSHETGLLQRCASEIRCLETRPFEGCAGEVSLPEIYALDVAFAKVGSPQAGPFKVCTVEPGPPLETCAVQRDASEVGLA